MIRLGKRGKWALAALVIANEIRGVLVVAALVGASPLGAQTVERGSDTSAAANRVAPIVIQLNGIPTSSLVTMLLRDVMRVPYVIAPDVLSDRRATSVRLVIPRDQIPQKVVGYLRSAGFNVALNGGTIYVGKSGSRAAAGGSYSFGGGRSPLPGRDWGDASVPMGSPLDGSPAPRSTAYPANVERVAETSQPSVKNGSDGFSPAAAFSPPDVIASDILTYLPAHRDPPYLAAVVTAMLPNVKAGVRADVEPQADKGNILPKDGQDVLVLSGSAPDLVKARKLIVVLDRARPMVAVKAVVMQMNNVQARGSALSVLASIGKGKFSLGSFNGAQPAAQFVRIASGAFSAVLSAVREDSRVKVVASPNLAALSGGVATMNAGSQVPTVGAVTFVEGSAPVQSITYRDSGITLTVRPVVRGDIIELAVQEERSTFVRTTTGVEDSPTLQKSSASASVVMRSGESVVLAGLSEASEGQRREGLLGGLLGVRSRDKSDGELLVLLTAELVPMPKAAPGIFLTIDDTETGKDEDDGNATLPPPAPSRRAPVAPRATERAAPALVRSTA